MSALLVNLRKLLWVLAKDRITSEILTTGKWNRNKESKLVCPRPKPDLTLPPPQKKDCTPYSPVALGNLFNFSEPL